MKAKDKITTMLLLFAAASCAAGAATTTVTDATIAAGTHDYGSDNVEFKPSGSSVTFESGSSVSANEIRFSKDAVTKGTELNAAGQLRIDGSWSGNGDKITVGSL